MHTENFTAAPLTDLKPAVLLVEDDHLDTMQFEREFRKQNLSNPVFVARNGSEALEMLHGGRLEKLEPRPGVVILDINMPRLNGLEFLHLLRRDPAMKDLKVFILTTSDDTAERDLARDLGVSGYLVKPFSFRDLSTGGANASGLQTLLHALESN